MLIRSPRAKPHRVSPCSSASVTASDVGAPTPTKTAAPAAADFWTSSKERPSADTEHSVVEGEEALGQRPADNLVHGVVAADVLADTDELSAASNRPVACSPPVRSNPGWISASGSAASADRVQI